MQVFPTVPSPTTTHLMGRPEDMFDAVAGWGLLRKRRIKDGKKSGFRFLTHTHYGQVTNTELRGGKKKANNCKLRGR